jgi:hypothetical protein
MKCYHDDHFAGSVEQVLSKEECSAFSSRASGESATLEVQDLAAALSAMSLRVKRMEEAAGVPQTPESCEILLLQALAKHLNSRLDKAEQRLTGPEWH